jgi:hypothetical protein
MSKHDILLVNESLFFFKLGLYSKIRKKRFACSCAFHTRNRGFEFLTEVVMNTVQLAGFLLGFYFDPENIGNVFLRNVGLSSNNTASLPRRPKSKKITTFYFQFCDLRALQPMMNPCLFYDCSPFVSSVRLQSLKFSQQLWFFMGWRCQNHAQPPKWRIMLSLFVWIITFELCDMEDPTSNYAQYAQSSLKHLIWFILWRNVKICYLLRGFLVLQPPVSKWLLFKRFLHQIMYALLAPPHSNHALSVLIP